MLSIYFTGMFNVAMEYHFADPDSENEFYCCCGDDGISTCQCTTACCNHPDETSKVKRNLFIGPQYNSCAGPAENALIIDLYNFVLHEKKDEKNQSTNFSYLNRVPEAIQHYFSVPRPKPPRSVSLV